jgi:hypothetical protein
MIIAEQKIKQHRFVSYLISVMGWLILVSSVILIAMLFLLYLASMQWAALPIVVLIVFVIVGLCFIVWGMLIRNRIDRLNNFCRIIGGRKQISIEELSKKANQNEEAVKSEIQTMLNLNYISKAYIDHQKQRLILDPLAEDEAEEIAAKEKADACQLIDGADSFLKALKEADQSIRSSVVSVHIWHIEGLAEKIFAAIKENPVKAGQIRKFLSYYLPTTIKLLKAYEVLEKQGIEQTNIVQTKANIEKALETIGLAFEKQLDKLFSKEALDVSTDIQVLETLLQQDGLGREDWNQVIELN